MRSWLAAALLAVSLAPVRAQVVADPSEMILGTVLAGPVHNREIILRNTGKSPAQVTSISGSCGCLTTGTVSKPLAPGETRAVPLILRTASLPAGPHAWTLAVGSREETGAQWTKTCRLSATIRREVELEPALLAVSGDREATVVVTIRDLREKPLTVTGWSGTLPGLAVDKKDSSGKETRLTVRIPAMSEGRHAGALLLATNDPTYARLEIPVLVQARARDSVRATPESLTLEGKAGTTVFRLVRLSASGDAPVRVVEVAAEGIQAATRHAAGPGNHATLRVETTLPAGKAAGSVKVRIEGRDQPVTIPVAVEGN